MRKKYPTAKRTHLARNKKKDKPLGNHVVVVTGPVGQAGCNGKAMGVGFGANEAAAKKDALRVMHKVFPWSSDGTVEHSKSY